MSSEFNLTNITINNKSVSVNTHYNIIQACNENNINIPKFCYCQDLSIAGNCRMCLVEVKGINKPIASCAIPVASNMTIYTDSKLVRKAREGILEFILINHPLDCPICDQGGECDLQDQSLVFGSDKGRFYEYKRSVNDKNCGPFIKTIMTRCIHCTRCIRFLDEIAGFKYLGLIGRGNNIEISNFINKSIYSELSGNIIDLCPVGALTLKTYSFKARPWELNSFYNIDILDPFHINTRVDIRDSVILRVLPIYNNIINENWITDITRYSFDGLARFRLLNPLKNIDNKFILLSWFEVFNELSNKLLNKNINFILGNFLDMETLLVLKKISSLKQISSNISLFSFNTDNKYLNNDFRNNYFISNKYINNLLDYDNLILVSSNIRLSNPLLNLKIKNFFKVKGHVFSIGSSYYNNFNVYNYSINLNDLVLLLKGKLNLNFLLLNKKNLFILNNNTNIDLSLLKNKINKYINIDFIVFNDNSNQQNLIKEINLQNSLSKFNDLYLKNLNNKNEINYFLNTHFNYIKSNQNCLNIFQGSNYHAQQNLKFNFLLPSVNFLEKNATYVNFLGYYQQTKFILYPPKNSRSDWKIFSILFNSLFLDTKINFAILSSYKSNFNLYYNKSFYNNKNLLIKKNIYNQYFKLNNNFISNYSNFNIYTSNQIIFSSKNIFNIFKKIKKVNSNFY